MSDGIIDDAAFPSPSGSARKRLNISLPLTDDGSVDWSSVTPRNKEKFNQASANAEAPESAQEINNEQTKFFAAQAVGVIFNVQAMLASAKTGIPLEETRKLFAFDADHFKGFEDALNRIMAKRGPEWLAKYQDEIFVGTVIIMSSATSWNAANQIAKQRKSSKSKPNGAEAKAAESNVADFVPYAEQ